MALGHLNCHCRIEVPCKINVRLSVHRLTLHDRDNLQDRGTITGWRVSQDSSGIAASQLSSQDRGTLQDRGAIVSPQANIAR